MLSELEVLARRLEQQIVSFGKLHADEMKRFEEQLATYRRLQDDELRMLHDELKQLQDEIAHLKQDDLQVLTVPTTRAAEPPTGHANLTLTRRELLTGKITLPSQTRI